MKKVLSRVSKTALLSTTLLLLVAPIFVPLFAQTTPTLTLSASPQALITGVGGSSTITWQSNSTGCTASGGWGGTKAASGSETVSPAVTTTYTLSCAGANGTQTSQEVTIVVGAADNTFANYKYLFNTAGHAQLGVGVNSSTFSFKSPIVDEGTKTVPGLWFKFGFEFGNEEPKNAEYSWDHISAPTGDISNKVFIVRVCDTGTNEHCVYHGAPYSEGIEAVADTPASWYLQFLPFIGPGFVSTSMGAQLKELMKAHKNTLVIYRKNSTQNGDYLRTGNFDLFLTGKWFLLGSPTSTNSSNVEVDVDWVTKTKTPQTASLWYCSSLVNGNGGTRQGLVPLPPFTAADTANDPDIQRLGGLCTDSATSTKSSFFKIAEIPVKEIISYEEAAQAQQSQVSESYTSKTFEQSILPACGVEVLGMSGSVLGCVARVIYYLVYRPIAWFAGIMGNLFDFFIGFSLDDSAYRQEFLVSGWRIVRDIANIFFIIILIWTGLATVFNIGSISMKRIVPQLIINAIIINFSLFATRTIIDISNVTSRVFYNNINVHKVDKNTGTDVSATAPTTLGGYKAMSEVIVGSFNPQKLFKAKFLSPNNALSPSQTVGSSSTVVDFAKNADDNSDSNLSPNEYAGYFILITLIAALLMFGVAMIFWKTAFLFLGRVIGLYISVIFSPFAFLTRENMPIVGNIPQVSWKQWLSDLVNYALMAPIFVFFLYIIWTFIKTLPDFMKTNGGDGSFFQTVIEIAIPLLIVYFLIKQGVGIAQKYAGSVAKSVQGYATKATGMAGGAALGLGAVGGARVLGGMARSLDQSRVGVGIRNMASKGGAQGWIGKKLQTGLNASQSESFDVRQTSIGKDLFKEMGLNTDQKVPGLAALSTSNTKGGLDAAITRQQKKKEDESKLLEEKMDIDAYNKEREAWAEKAIEAKMIENNTAAATGFWGKRAARKAAAAEVADWKEKDKDRYKAEKERAMGDAQIQAVVASYKKDQLRSADEMNAGRRESFIKNLKEGSLFNQFLESIKKSGPLGEVGANILGATVGTTVANALGSQITTVGNKKAIKKVEEKNKAAKEIIKVQEILANGFKDLIALEQFRTSPQFTSLSRDDQEKILKGEKNFYKDLSDTDKRTVDRKHDILSNDEKKSYMEQIKLQQEGQYDIKKMKEELKRKRNAAATEIRSGSGRRVAFDDFRAYLKEMEKAQKHQSVWADVNKYMEDQKKKMKEE